MSASETTKKTTNANIFKVNNIKNLLNHGLNGDKYTMTNEVKQKIDDYFNNLPDISDLIKKNEDLVYDSKELRQIKSTRTKNENVKSELDTNPPKTEEDLEKIKGSVGLTSIKGNTFPNKFRSLKTTIEQNIKSCDADIQKLESTKASKEELKKELNGKLREAKNDILGKYREWKNGIIAAFNERVKEWKQDDNEDKAPLEVDDVFDELESKLKDSSHKEVFELLVQKDRLSRGKKKHAQSDRVMNEIFIKPAVEIFAKELTTVYHNHMAECTKNGYDNKPSHLTLYHLSCCDISDNELGPFLATPTFKQLQSEVTTAEYSIETLESYETLSENAESPHCVGAVNSIKKFIKGTHGVEATDELATALTGIIFEICQNVTESLRYMSSVDNTNKANMKASMFHTLLAPMFINRGLDYSTLESKIDSIWKKEA